MLSLDGIVEQRGRITPYLPAPEEFLQLSEQLNAQGIDLATLLEFDDPFVLDYIVRAIMGSLATSPEVEQATQRLFDHLLDNVTSEQVSSRWEYILSEISKKCISQLSKAELDVRSQERYYNLLRAIGSDLDYQPTFWPVDYIPETDVEDRWVEPAEA